MTISRIQTSTSPMHVQAEGHGETILFLHAAASSGAQWKKAASFFSPRYRVVIPDLTGEGRSPSLKDMHHLLREEVAMICDIVATGDIPIHLVGHSYGGVLAMKIAREFPWLVKSLTLIEPVAFHLLKHRHSDYDLDVMWDVKKRCSQAISNADGMTAAKYFVSYWSGEKYWDILPSDTQAFLSKGMKKVVIGWEAICRAPEVFDDYRNIQAPTLVVAGDKSPQPIRWVAQQLYRTLPDTRYVEIANAGHMSPVTHATDVIAALADHISCFSECSERCL